MKNRKDILAKAIQALKKTKVPPEPTQQVVNSTLAKLSQTGGDFVTPIPGPHPWASFLKYAAAAVFLIASGYLTGRLTAPKPQTTQELYSALKPAIKQELLEPINKLWQVVLAKHSAELEDRLREDFQRQLNEYAVQTLTASSEITNQLLQELIESIDSAQTHNTQWVAASLEQIELNRIKDSARLSDALVTFAVQTENELQQTKQDMIQLISYTQQREPVRN